jgi:hypothetical protein
MKELYDKKYVDNFESSVYKEILKEFQSIFNKDYQKNQTYIENFLNKYFKLLVDQESYLYNPIIQLIRYLEENYQNELPQTITSSSGSSVVIVADTVVFQYYKSRDVKKKICDIYKRIIDNNLFEYDGIEYNLTDYIVPVNTMLCNINNDIIIDHVIIWTKIQPVNLIKERVNIFKMKRDIDIALNGLQQKRIAHGDTRIDNIGFYNGKYILFDFDMSKIVKTDDYELLRNDFIIFLTSLKFNFQN